ncbi:hypothetical protein Mgra_00001396 [Meloidogyne graminicola]|uniref:ER membrane protein complex subunit 10 n=1 Tax=Meloidogyne graminicola TaxID=189291 RepID=A0A8T0A260_9BILA|nr:hypothetical protein Mgra_00001396 [Meloidogyne graminicola]
MFIICFILFFLHYSIAFQEFTVPLEYSVGDSYSQLGQIRIKPLPKRYNNIEEDIPPATAEFTALSTEALIQWRKTLEENPSVKDYKLKSGQIFSSNSVEGYINSKYAHLLVITADLDNQQILSLTHFPAPLSLLNNITNVKIKERTSPLILFRIQGIVDLPGPDTATYLKRVEEEKRARQQGATQDNRSFIQKYWIYFVPVIVFMVSGGILFIFWFNLNKIQINNDLIENALIEGDNELFF